MKRFSENQLIRWLGKTRRKPLVIRGARQVGKSTLVQNFAQSQGLKLAEINLEKHGNLNAIFGTNDLDIIIPELELLTRTSLRQKNTLLFLDEIQSTPDAIAALRYFHEEMPQLPVIAAGSLLEFVLEKHDFSMPVGRVEYLHLGPMTFKEFLMAAEDDILLSYIEGYQLGRQLPQTAHQKLLQRQRQYLYIGGMPESILAFCESGSMIDSRDIHRSIVQTYRDDFAKYSHEPTLGRIHTVFNAMAWIVGEKVKYTNISREDRAKDLKQAIGLLTKARLLIPAFHSNCSGIPIRSGINEKFYKLYFLDIGLLNYLNGLEWAHISTLADRSLLNEGVLAEQFIAQHLAYRYEGLEPPDLFYWLREKKTGNAEVDFVASAGKIIVPIEVKAGKSGSIKSLQQFTIDKKSILTCRFDLNQPSIQDLSHRTRQKQRIQTVNYKFVSLPLYLVEVMHTVLTEVLNSQHSNQ
ncbi:MAG: ATP-binding protein [Deltaproteobacteria bacterium]|nr:ATP-binding protein [Deltaproteobacteria bacterium]